MRFTVLGVLTVVLTLEGVLESGMVRAGQEPAPLTDKSEKQPVDRYGDPLPPGGIGRLGTVRFRHSHWVNGLAYSRDSKLLASSSRDGIVRLWDPATGKELRVYRRQLGPDGQRNDLMDVAISPDGKTLIGLENGDCVVVWDVQSGKQLRELKGHNGFSMALSPDGRTLVKGLGGEKPTQQLGLWNLTTGQPIREMGATKRHVQSVAFSPDGTILAAGDGPSIQLPRDHKGGYPCAIRLWDHATGLELRILEGHEGGVRSLSFSPDGKLLASASHDATIRIWESETGKQLRTIKVPDASDDRYGSPNQMKGIHVGGLLAIAFSPDGKLLASGSYDGTVRLWDPATGKEILTLRGHSREVNGVAFSPDGKTLATASWDHTIRLWATSTGKTLQPRQGHDGPVYNIAVSPDGKLVAASCWDHTVRLWSVATQEQLHIMHGHADNVRSLAFSPDGSKLASASDDKTVRIWDVETGKETGKLVGHAGGVHRVVFISPGKVLASAGYRTIRLWDWSAGKELHQLRGKNGFYSLQASADGKLLGAGSARDQPHLWTTEPIKELRKVGGIYARFALMPDGRTCLTEEEDGTIHLWNVATGEEIRQFAGPGYSSGWSGVLSLVTPPNGRLLARHTGQVIELWEITTGKIRRQLVGHRGRSNPLAFASDGRTLFSGGGDTTILIWDLTRRHERTGAKLAAADLNNLWNDVRGDDAERADRAIHTLAARPEESVPFLKANLRPVGTVEPEHLSKLIGELESEQFALRQKATEELTRLDEQAVPALRNALKEERPLEARRRIEQILAKTRLPLIASDQLRSLRGVETLEIIGTAPARQVLQSLAKGAANARITEDAKSTLRRLGQAGW